MNAWASAGSVDRSPLPAVFDAAAFDRELAQSDAALGVFRDALVAGSASLLERFRAGHPIEHLVEGRSALADELLQRAWELHLPGKQHSIALVAVGGYGRGELLPGSDIDLMILLERDTHGNYREPLEAFLAFLWDIGLEVGHSVRSLRECAEEAARDITVATNLMEARLLCGPWRLLEAMREHTGPSRIWPVREFFEAKCEEQRARHQKYHDTAYNLEPNVKESPGGLRDIQVIGWVAKRHFKAATMDALVGHEFLTETEYRALMDGQAFLWRARYGLHTLTGRGEDRMLFDHQRPLAELLGYRDTAHTLGVELMMQDYYRSVMELARLNEMLLQLFQEAIVFAGQESAAQPINKRFRSVNGYVEVTSDEVFRRYPLALLEIFLILAEHGELKGVRAATIRLIRDHRYLIDQRFRHNLGARTLFIEILRQPHGVLHELRRMNRYGILASYIPPFGKIIGRMQYDLFHVYTVDEHTLFVIRNLRRMALPKFAQELPFCSTLFQRIPKPEVLYVAALFHDIAKGRGGDHSELGADDAEAFCKLHNLNRSDTALVTWLVRNHLIMSITAQRKDISDPDIIHDFARHVGDKTRLTHLYLLTVADIRGTNPTLWNSWKDSLLRELYFATARALRRGLGNPIDRDKHIREARAESRARLVGGGLSIHAVNRLWANFDDEYFLRYRPDEIAWQTRAIVGSAPQDLPVVLVRRRTDDSTTEVFVYSRDRRSLFAKTTSVLDQLGLTVLDARIITSRDGYTLDTYLVLEESGESIDEMDREDEIRTTLQRQISGEDLEPVPVSRRKPRQYKHFDIETEVQFENDESNGRTVLELITADRPGLLSRVGRAFLECGVQLRNAKIATFGSRAEDVFFLSDEQGSPITDPAQLRELRDAIFEHLDGGTKPASE